MGPHITLKQTDRIKLIRDQGLMYQKTAIQMKCMQTVHYAYQAQWIFEQRFQNAKNPKIDFENGWENPSIARK